MWNNGRLAQNVPMASTRPRLDGTQSIERTVVLLRALAERGRLGWGLTDLAQAAGLAKPTAHRILSRLEHERLVHRRAGGDRYVLGPALGELSLCIPGFHDFVAQAQDCALAVARELGLVTIVSLRSGDHFVIASRIETDRMRSRINEEGAFRPLICTAGGIAILISFERAEQERVIADNLRELASRGRTRFADCHAMLKRSRRLGVGTNFGDIAAGTNAIAVPFGPDGREAMGSLTVAGPDSQLDESRCMALAQRLREHGERLARLAKELGLGPQSSSPAA